MVPRRREVDSAALAVLLSPGRSVATHAELKALGVPVSTIISRCRRDGPWQRLLPGVVAGHRGTSTAYERRLAAIKYAGRGAALTGLDALDDLGLPIHGVIGDGKVHVLVPHENQRLSHGFALVTRTERPPTTTVRRNLPRVGVARAVFDATRRLDDLDQVRTLVARAVQRRRCTVEELATEVRDGPRQRTALVRTVLREVGAGVRSQAEAEVRVVFRRFGVPEPRWNAAVRDADGEVVGVADGLFEEEELVIEIDSMEFHLEPAAYKRTQARQRKFVLAGKTVMPVAPSVVLRDPEPFCREVLAALALARARRTA